MERLPLRIVQATIVMQNHSIIIAGTKGYKNRIGSNFGAVLKVSHYISYFLHSPIRCLLFKMSEADKNVNQFSLNSQMSCFVHNTKDIQSLNGINKLQNIHN